MKYNTAVRDEKKAAFRYFMTLSNKKQIIEVKKVSPSRTLRQNSYLHLIIAAFGVHFGYRLHEAKTVYKRQANPDIYVYENKGAKFLRSSADLDKEEMSKTIERFKQFSAEQGYPLPDAEDVEWLRQLENEVERHDWIR